MTVRVGDLLDSVLAGGPPITDPVPLLDELRAGLDDAARAATDGVDPDLLPLRIPKDRIGRVLTCEALAMATGAGGGLSEAIVRGRILDRLLHHHVHGGGPAPGPALAIAEGAFAAERDDEVLAWLTADAATRARLADDAADFAERLRHWGPIEGAWWPRCEDRLRVDLAGGRLVCAARIDLVAGGGPTGRPLVVVEVKSGRFGQDHREGLFWYALVAALRHREPPAAAVAWSAWDGSGWSQPVTEAVLRGAAARARTAIVRLGALARGAVPSRTPSRACTWCPERATCAAAVDLEDGDDDGW